MIELAWQEGTETQLLGIFHYGRSLFLAIFLLFFFFFFLFCLHISGTLKPHVARLNYSTDSLLQVRLLCALCFTTHPCLFFLKSSSCIFSFLTTSRMALTIAYLLNNDFKCCYSVTRRIYVYSAAADGCFIPSMWI